MDEPRPRPSVASRSALVGAAAGLVVAVIPALFMWGFTVDDALVSVRYATRLAAGEGYRFSRGMPPTDGVTPLSWAPLLAALAPRDGGSWELLVRAKVLGVAAYAASLVALGVVVARGAVTRSERVAAAVSAMVLALAFPLGAWAASGMETGLVVALATSAVVAFRRPRIAALLAGAAASLRPELVPWALVVGSGAAVASREGAQRVRGFLEGAAFAAAPFALCTVIRLLAFGRAAPLSVLAKPSDLEHGATYALAATVVVLLPIVVAAPLAIVRSTPRAKVLAVAFVAHVAAVALAGGDWMPFARLLVPVVPSLVLVAVDAMSHAHRGLAGARACAASVLGVLLLLRAAPAGRSVMADRAELVARARPFLVDAHVVAALDVGWVSAATDAAIVDLAGLTDPTIAVLRGGHTSKRVDVGMLLDRDVDTVVVYGDRRVVEERLVRAPLFEERYVHAAAIPFGRRGATYDVYRRRTLSANDARP